MKETTERHKYYKWNISSGDYYKDYESTEGYVKKFARDRRIKKNMKVLGYLVAFSSALIYYVSYLH